MGQAAGKQTCESWGDRGPLLLAYSWDEGNDRPAEPKAGAYASLLKAVRPA